MRVLCIAAHPDDEVLGCGGTLARMVVEGHDVCIAIMGEGLTSRKQDRTEVGAAQLEELASDARNAAAILGVADVRTFGLPDNRFDTIPLLEIVKELESLIKEVDPAMIYTHHPSDLNVDHTCLNRAVLTATRPVPRQGVRTIHTFEIPSSTDWHFGMGPVPFVPNAFVDVSGTLDKKIAAMLAYETEARAFPHPRSPEALRATAQRWGSVVGCHAAEAFQQVRSLM